MSDNQQTSRIDSPATTSLTPMDLDMNAAPTAEQQQLYTPLGTTEFKSPSQANLAAVKQEFAQPAYPPPPPPPTSSVEAITTAIGAETNKQEKSLAEFLAMMDNYTPIIPDAVTDYYLSRTGFDSDDVRIKRLLALAAQKFVADIATDAFQYCKVRQSGNRSRAGKDRKTVLTMEDLSAALAEYGVNVKKPDYYS
ncbi:Transcription initiation factor TFIID subunit 10 [Apophysomyces sp. BC1034]|nr:Transcription initiation factor TFIID subunit 10 [Apophysomyces sp. BC1015]KAG0174773.1 Transcription initiation factor TFIID subunit 10 [Apophysomyces sp. BC1021]KAG0185878.1 Transcription initiation factor TFIID subunit 10 [Apophysomyces sp. BC1034]